ncbi:MAG: EF-P lysine aminoacylase GenX [Proteobacteria bacterium]|nr:MAG: EF-P lysine aminoacylase GenX [Pseudomonadota bacterium]
MVDCKAEGTQGATRRERFARKKAYLHSRDLLVRALRQFFYNQGFQEVSTPALQISPGLEPHLQAFQTDLIDPVGGRRCPRYLHTSPEFAMKKLLASGMEKIFQVAQVFRNRERSGTHHPEFSMLEWYRVGEPYTKLMDDCEGLLRACKQAAGGPPVFRYRGKEARADLPFARVTVQEAFEKYAGINLLATIDDYALPAPGKLLEACRSAGIHTAPDDTWEDLFFRIFLEKIEAHLGVGVPTILTDYPISMAALSRPKPGAPHLAERFEVYVCGLELANAFGELTDAKVQRARFEADMEKKQKLYGERYPIDEDFLRALEEGLPECSGIALGVDRLAMLATGAPEIDDVLWITVAGPGESHEDAKA